MFDKYEVIKRLQNGETLDEIADSMTAVLNDAANEYEKSKINIERENKISDMREILDLIHDYLLDYYTNSHTEINTINEIFSDKMVEKVVDEMDTNYKKINSLFNCIKSKEKPDVTVLNMLDAISKINSFVF